MPQPYQWIAPLVQQARHIREYRAQLEAALPEFWNRLVPAIKETIQRYNAEIGDVLPAVEAREGPGNKVALNYRGTSERLGEITADPTTVVWRCFLGDEAEGCFDLDFDANGRIVGLTSRTVKVQPVGLSTVLLRNILFHDLFEDPLYERPLGNRPGL